MLQLHFKATDSQEWIRIFKVSKGIIYMSEQIQPGEMINILFEVLRRSSGKSFTYKEVAQRVGITETTLATIRTKVERNPTLPTLQGISKFFDIPLDYFNCNTAEECYAFIANVKAGKAGYKAKYFEDQPLLQEIMKKAMSMSDESQKETLKVMGWIEAAHDTNGKRRAKATV